MMRNLVVEFKNELLGITEFPEPQRRTLHEFVSDKICYCSQRLKDTMRRQELLRGPLLDAGTHLAELIQETDNLCDEKDP